MSVNAPPPIEISSTVPSNVSSRLKLCLKVSLLVADVIAMDGLSSVLFVTQDGSLWKAEFGAVSLVVLTVVQLPPSAHRGPPTVQSPSPLVKAVTQPAGNAGAVTPSKFSLNAIFCTPSVNV